MSKKRIVVPTPEQIEELQKPYSRLPYRPIHELLALKGRKDLRPAEQVLLLLHKPGTRMKFKEIMAQTGLSRQILSQAITEVRNHENNLVFGKFDRTYYFSEVTTWYSNRTDLSQEMPLEGSFGLISETHMASDAERLDLINLAYDTYEKRGIKKVFHCGDVSDGWKEYKGHHNFVKVYGDHDQALYVVEKYPRKKDMLTYFIGGNHDDSYKNSKVDRMSLIVNGFEHKGKHIPGRKDMVYLGQYSHNVIFPQEVNMHMVHPRGGNTYAISYRAQKRSEAMDRNLRPDIQASGHFHTYFHLWLNHTHFLGCPGLQDETEFFVRLGLPRNLGFMIVHYEIKDGKLVSLCPEAFMYT